RFDLELAPERQQAIRDLDRRIAELDPARQSDYRAVLRRYHNWLSHLPENRREELLSSPAAQRMALVAKLVVDYPVPGADTPQFLRVAELGENSPFELAAIFSIWQKAIPAERARLERLPPGPRRREALFRLGDGLGLPREIKPATFEEETWLARVEGQWKNRPLSLVDELLKRKLEE